MYTLVIWTVVAAWTGFPISDWRPIGEFATEQACYNAGVKLRPSNKQFLCLYKGQLQ